MTNYLALRPGAPLAGGVFAGFIYPEGCVQALILGPEHGGELTWDAAMAWTAGLRFQGHDDWTLPTRAEQALLWVNVRHLFSDRWYWSCEQHESVSGYAWYQYFGDGGRNGWRKDNYGRARAVRRELVAGT